MAFDPDQSSPLLESEQSLEGSIDGNVDRNITLPKDQLRKILAALWIGSFLSALDSTVVATTMVGIASEFDDVKNVSWIATSYLLTNTVFQPLYGKTSDIVGRKLCLLFAQFWFTLGCLICCFSNSVTQFAIARAIAGIGGGGVSALSSIIVSDVVSLEDRGIYQGYANVIYGVAQALGGPIGGYLFQTIGWRWAFGIQVPFMLFCGVLAFNYVNIHAEHIPKGNKRFTRENLSRLDFAGSLTLVISTSALILLFSSDITTSGLYKSFVSFIAVIGFSAFIYVENYVAKEQIIPSNLIKGILGITAFVAAFGSMALYNSIFLTPQYLQVVENITPVSSGTFIMFQVLAVSFGSLVAGMYLRKSNDNEDNQSNDSSFTNEESKNEFIKARAIKISFFSILLIFVGMTLIDSQVYVTEPYSLGLVWRIILVIGLSFIGFGYGIFLVSLLIIVVATVGRSGQAAATGMNYLFRSTGNVLGVSISLSTYNNKVIGSLKSYLADKPNGSEIFEKLLENVNYLKDIQDASLKETLLNIYRKSFAVGFIPGVSFSFIALALTTYLITIRKK
ncbi:hypothetical protein PACTADRAFT_2171 [Pachysolen tannophilus NRRL Y-2460]|uniref:Major facilitator superfamily (MFS) profile domain-containing protein n=1 Tax=Pachysolen tannophilus NRRL Y-2460 TaxID=669874 RepID=A0A1E4TVV2_PACTA|nr:hypothetical protein PACTADRAFT_2171 [Pachysolen tannophilus NRRL Y-2460]